MALAYEQMKRHSVLGAEIAAAAGLSTEARWIRHHHERYDGNGYPDRLAGKDIPLQSRIILTADAFEAMTSDRPYRDAPGRDFAIAELKRNAGTEFDPEIVQAFCRALESSPDPTPTSMITPAATATRLPKPKRYRPKAGALDRPRAGGDVGEQPRGVSPSRQPGAQRGRLPCLDAPQ